MSHLVACELAEFAPFIQFLMASRWSERSCEQGISDFVFGNPHDGVLSGDDRQFADTLAGQDVFVLPGSYFERPGYVRFSLTATDAMIERAIPILRDAID